MVKENQEKRKVMKLFDIIVLIIIVAICVGVYFFFINKKEENDSVAQITYDGKVVQTIVLATAEDKIFTLQENNKVNFEIKNHQIRFIDTDCPDKLCENVGFISRHNEVAICMPNKVTLKIIGQANDFDAIAN